MKELEAKLKTQHENQLSVQELHHRLKTINNSDANIALLLKIHKTLSL
jgi:hypothetical protein